MPNLKKISVVLLHGCLLSMASWCTHAADYPNKPVRMVVAYAPGGGNDVTARILAARLGETMGVTFVVDNRPGATGIIGTELVARSPADGYTLILADAPHAINPFVFPSARYDPVKDFEPISIMATAPVVLVVHPGVPVQSLSGFIAYAKSQDGKVAMATGGTGTISHLTGELFWVRTAIQLNHIPYKGSGPAIADTVGGQAQCMFPPTPASVSQVKSGKLRALAVSSAKRSSAIPDVPTFEESGAADFRVENWYGALAPAGTPKRIVVQVNREIVAATQFPAIKDRFAGVLLDPAGSSASQFVELLNSEASCWSQLIKQAGIKAG
jgi:tripartite-type tricarboxylate transporter receptor subunit TctC